jgi:non-heme chloroperoxidase
MVAERFTSRSGVKIRYLDNEGDGPGLPILFSPGLTDFADEYLQVLDFFLPRRLLVVEVRGRGGSEAPATGYSVWDHKADLAAVLDEEGIDRFHLLTFSRGTSWAMELAYAQPERVASIAIGDYRAVELDVPDSYVEQQMQTRFRGKPMAERVQRHVIEQIFKDSRGRELWDQLAQLTQPLLLGKPGGDGAIVTDEVVATYRAARPDVEVVVIPDAPHDIFRPDRLYWPRAVVDFLDRRCPGL